MFTEKDHSVEVEAKIFVFEELAELEREESIKLFGFSLLGAAVVILTIFEIGSPRLPTYQVLPIVIVLEIGLLTAFLVSCVRLRRYRRWIRIGKIWLNKPNKN
jgi:hypothetical protein